MISFTVKYKVYKYYKYMWMTTLSLKCENKSDAKQIAKDAALNPNYFALDLFAKPDLRTIKFI